MKQTINQLKQWFSKFKYPTQSQFWDWLDSFWHKDDIIPLNNIDGLQDIYDNKIDKVPTSKAGNVALFDGNGGVVDGNVDLGDYATVASVNNKTNSLWEYFHKTFMCAAGGTPRDGLDLIVVDKDSELPTNVPMNTSALSNEHVTVTSGGDPRTATIPYMSFNASNSTWNMTGTNLEIHETLDGNGALNKNVMYVKATRNRLGQSRLNIWYMDFNLGKLRRLMTQEDLVRVADPVLLDTTITGEKTVNWGNNRYPDIHTFQPLQRQLVSTDPIILDASGNLIVNNIDKSNASNWIWTYLALTNAIKTWLAGNYDSSTVVTIGMWLLNTDYVPSSSTQSGWDEVINFGIGAPLYVCAYWLGSNPDQLSYIGGFNPALGGTDRYLLSELPTNGFNLAIDATVLNNPNFSSTVNDYLNLTDQLFPYWFKWTTSPIDDYRVPSQSYLFKFWDDMISQFKEQQVLPLFDTVQDYNRLSVQNLGKTKVCTLGKNISGQYLKIFADTTSLNNNLRSYTVVLDVKCYRRTTGGDVGMCHFKVHIANNIKLSGAKYGIWIEVLSKATREYMPTVYVKYYDGIGMTNWYITDVVLGWGSYSISQVSVELETNNTYYNNTGEVAIPELTGITDITDYIAVPIPDEDGKLRKYYKAALGVAGQYSFQADAAPAAPTEYFFENFFVKIVDSNSIEDAPTSTINIVKHTEDNTYHITCDTDRTGQTAYVCEVFTKSDRWATAATPEVTKIS